MLAVAVLVTAWLVLIAYAYPGMMTIDSVDQLREARAGFYTDAHPPAMAALWRLVEYVHEGPFGMLVLQSVSFVAGLYLVLRRALQPVPAAIAAAVLTLFPPILTPLAVIWKDCLMAGSLLLGIGLLLSECRNVRLAGLGMLVVATAVRYNAPAATLAPIVLLCVVRAMPRWRYSIAIAVWLGVTILGLGIDKVLTDQPMHFWHSTLAPMDIVGTTCHADEKISDGDMRERLRGSRPMIDTDIQAAMCRAYNPRDYGGVISGPSRIWDLPFSGDAPAPPEQRAALEHLFWSTVSAHPVAYLEHRLAVMRWVLALTSEPPNSTVMLHKLQPEALHDLGIHSVATPKQGLWSRRFSRLATHTPLYRPWIYALLALILLAFCRRHADIAALLLSGLGAEGSLLLFAGSGDYRYSHWLVVCTCTALVMLVARRIVLHRRREAT
jgi:hypothetical protein